MLNTMSISSNRVGRTAAWSLIVIASLLPMMTGVECNVNEAQANQIRTDVAPSVAGVFGSLGDMIGAGVASWIKPVPEEEPAASSLQ